MIIQTGPQDLDVITCILRQECEDGGRRWREAVTAKGGLDAPAAAGGEEEPAD